MASDDQPAKRRKSGPSGPTQGKDARREAGRVRVEVWISEEAAERLDAIRGERSRREAVEALIMMMDCVVPGRRSEKA